MWSYLLANIILGVPACVAAVVITKKRNNEIDARQRYNDCELCGNLNRLNSKRLGSRYRYECCKCGSFDIQPDYCKYWVTRETSHD